MITLACRRALVLWKGRSAFPLALRLRHLLLAARVVVLFRLPRTTFPRALWRTRMHTQPPPPPQ